jgi:hypothetical protein
LIRAGRLFSASLIAGLLVGCVPLFSKYTYISLEGDWADKVVRKGKVEVDSGTNFFTGEINVEYRYALDGFIVHAKLLSASLPSVEFRLENLQGEAQELSIFSNHPCYFNQGLSYKRGDAGKFLLPMEVDNSIAIYQFVEIDPLSMWTKVNMPECYKKHLQESLFITLKFSSNGFALTVPIKINKEGFQLHFDGL